jgi:O-antigen/teichoic acid export membrane protein
VPDDAVDTVETGRHRERHRRIVGTGASSGLARLVSFTVTIVSVRLAVRSLGVEDFGVYAAIAGLASLMALLDLGVGNALVREIAKASVKNETAHLRALVSSAFYPLAILVGLACVSLAVFVRAVDLVGLLNTPPSFSPARLGTLTLLAFTPYLLAMPLSIVVRVRYGLQEGYRSHLWQAVGFVLQLVLVVVASQRGAGLEVFVVLLGAGAALGYLADVAAMLVARSWALPRWRFVERPLTRRLLRSGSAFFALSVAAAVGYQTDALVISHFLGSTQVTTYSVTFQLVVVCPIALSLFLNALWPAYSEAHERGDIEWIRRTFRRSLLVTVPAATASALALVVAAPAVLHVWIGPDITPPADFLWASAGYIVINGFTGPLAMLLNGLGRLRAQVAASAAMAVTNLFLSIVLVQHIGIAGPIVGTNIAQVVCIIVPMGAYAIRVLQHDLPAGAAPA